jgi:hypothetical protein
MVKRLQRSAGAFAVAAVVMAGTAAVTVIAAPVASAHCENDREMQYLPQPGPFAREASVWIFSGEPPTCDGDYYYRGWLDDELTDGSCVWVQYADQDLYATMATSCDRDGIGYTYSDYRGNNATYLRICRNQGCSGWIASFGY